MLITKVVSVDVTKRTVTHYRELGYDIPTIYNEKSGKYIPDFNSQIMVNTKDLPEHSHVKIQYQCDNCGGVFTTEYHYWNNAKLPELGDLCHDCATKIKLPQIMIDKYNCKNPSQSPEIIAKKKQTNLERYGNEWAIASESVRDKIIDVFIDKYGVDNPMKNETVKNKAIRTNNVKYGGNSAMCSDDIKVRLRESIMRKYGVSSTAKLPEVRAKMRRTLYKNGNVPSSKAEQKMCSILKEMYGEENCHPGHPVFPFFLDCLVVIGETNIDFEYDGLYWHKNKERQDRTRNAVLMNNGYKIIRIKGNNADVMPSKEQIQQAVDYLVRDNHHITFIDMNK